MSEFEEVLAALGASQININDLPDSDPAVAHGRTCEALFTSGIDALRTVVPNDRVRALATVVWDLVGHKQVQVAIGFDVPSLSFTVMRLKGTLQGVVMLPKNWPAMVKEDPYMQLGAQLFIGVQIVDFYNDRLIGDATSPPRWGAYEAELLHTFKPLLPDWTPNAYQREVMAKYPDGLDSAGVELYTYEPARGST